MNKKSYIIKGPPKQDLSTDLIFSPQVLTNSIKSSFKENFSTEDIQRSFHETAKREIPKAVELLKKGI